MASGEGVAVALSRVPIAFGIGALLLGCSGGADRRTPAELAAPSPEDWQGLAGDLADDIVGRAAEHDTSAPVVLMPVEGGAPPYFHDLLLAALLDHGVRVTATGEAPLRIGCRATPLGMVPHARGLTGSEATPPGEILVLCLLARDGTYIAAVQRSLPAPLAPEPPDQGIAVEVTG
jgi:hypothetical protein